MEEKKIVKNKKSLSKEVAPKEAKAVKKEGKEVAPKEAKAVKKEGKEVAPKEAKAVKKEGKEVAPKEAKAVKKEGKEVAPKEAKAVKKEGKEVAPKEAKAVKKVAKKVGKEEVVALDPQNSTLDLTKIVCEALSEKKANNIVYINIEKRTTIADYFVLADSQSTRSVAALCDHIEQKLEKEYGIRVNRIEGRSDARWIAMDYGFVIVHIFLGEVREVYQLEKLWTEGAESVAWIDKI